MTTELVQKILAELDKPEKWTRMNPYLSPLTSNDKIERIGYLGTLKHTGTNGVIEFYEDRCLSFGLSDDELNDLKGAYESVYLVAIARAEADNGRKAYLDARSHWDLLPDVIDSSGKVQQVEGTEL